MIENAIIKNRPKLIYTLFPKNKKLRISKQDLKYFSKGASLENSCNSNYMNTNKINLSKKTKLSERFNILTNSYLKKKYNFNEANSNYNDNYIYKMDAPKQKYNIVSSTSINFWKGENGNKYKFNNFIKKNNKNSTNVRTNNFMNINIIKNDRGSSVEQKYTLNSKLFEEFISQYEQKIKKALLDIGVNPDICSEENNDKENYPNENDNYYYNLPFLNTNNIKISKSKNNNKIYKAKNNKTYDPNIENNIFEENEYTNEILKDINDSTNSNNGNNNVIFKNSIKKNFTGNLDNFSTNVNTKSYTINSRNSTKGKENKLLISPETFGLEKINLEKLNTEKMEKLEKIKKARATSTTPYTMRKEINGDNYNDNNKIEIRNYHYYNSENTSSLFRTKNTKNELSNYEIGYTLGKGAYAIVKFCINKITLEKYAMKIYDKLKLNDNSKKKCVYREIEILKRINHKNIAKLFDVITTKKQILILQELVNGISLREYYNKEIRNQKGISEHKSKILKKIFKQIFDAMNYIHKRNIAHRDIKLENILMTKNYDIKIIDFGFGIYNPENKLQNFFCGTPNYMPPEIAFKKPYDGQKADLWSLGVLVYKMFCADFPFKGKNEKELYKAIKIGKFRMASYTPDYARKIIVSMIVLNPNKRMSCDMVLKSEWLRD